MRSSITILSLAASAVAQTQIPFFVPGLSDASDPGVSPAASIVKVASSTTVMQLGCASGVASESCPWVGFTYTIASSSIYAAAVSYADLSISFACTSKGSFVCEMHDPASLMDETATGMATVTTTLENESVIYVTATVTAGEEKLGATGAAEPSGAAEASSGSTLATSATAGAKPSASGPTPTGSASPSGSAAPSQSTGAAGKFGVEGAALFVLAGAAAMQML